MAGAADRRTEFETNFVISMLWKLHGGSTWLAFPIAVTLAESEAPYTPVTVDIQTTITYPFGPASVPILLNLTFAGDDMPIDVEDEPIGAGLVVVTEHVFTVPATGTVTPTATDDNGIEATAHSAETITILAAGA